MFTRYGTLVLTLVVSLSTPAFANHTDCKRLEVAPGIPYFDLQTTPDVWRYRVDASSFDFFYGDPEYDPGIYGTQWATLVVTAADVWNEQADARPFLYIGESSISDIPLDNDVCVAQGINYSLVKMVAQDPSRGRTLQRCIDQFGLAHQFLITLSYADTAGVPRAYSGCPNCVPETSTTYDARQVITHEFGHTLNIDHPIVPAPPEVRVAAAMRPDNPGTKRFRDLYYWDQKCARQYSSRYRKPYFIQQTGLSTFSTPTSAFPTATASHASIGIRDSGGWRDWLTANESQGNTTVANDELSDGFWVINSLKQVSPRATLWREQPSLSRVVYNTLNESPQYDEYAKRWFEMSSSSDGFATRTNSVLKHCTSMTGFLTCTQKSSIYSAYPISTASLNGITVVAWANQTRTDNADDREVKISIGRVDDVTVSQPDGLGVQSFQSPSVACDANATPYQCVVAYNTSGGIAVRRFSISSNASRYFVVSEGVNYYPGIATGSPVALWYHPSAGRFYIAHRSNWAGQNLYVHYSTNGANWTLLKTGPNWFDPVVTPDTNVLTGPSVPAYYSSASSKIMYIK